MKVIITNLLEMSLTASVVILAVMAARLILRRAPKIYSYVLWSIVALRLCIPASFESSISIFNLFNKQEIAQPVTVPGVATPSKERFDIYGLLGCVWLCGILVLVIYSVFSYFRLQHRLKVSFPLYDNVYEVDELKSPFVIGFVKPKIYIPMRLDKETENYILMHERTHLKRGDHLIKLFAFALLCMHWFNPLCWVAFIFMSRDMEMSCDEKVLGTGDISDSYSTALLSFAANTRFPSPGPLCFGEVSVKRRIKNILSWRKPALWITMISVIICATAFAVCACDPVEPDEPVQPEITEPTAVDTGADTTTADTITADTTTADTTTADTTTPDTTAVPDTIQTQKATAVVTTQAPVTENNYYYYETEEDTIETTDLVIEPPVISYPYPQYKEEGHDLLDDFIDDTSNVNDAVIIIFP